MHYILVEVDDASKTNALVKKLRQIAHRGVRVVGVYVAPDKDFCQCGTLTDRRQGQEVRRGDKYGWFIHVPCGKPRRHVGYSPNNLLERGLPVRRKRFFITAHEEGS